MKAFWESWKAKREGKKWDQKQKKLAKAVETDSQKAETSEEQPPEQESPAPQPPPAKGVSLGSAPLSQPPEKPPAAREEPETANAQTAEPVHRESLQSVPPPGGEKAPEPASWEEWRSIVSSGDEPVPNSPPAGQPSADKALDAPPPAWPSGPPDEIPAADSRPAGQSANASPGGIQPADSPQAHYESGMNASQAQSGPEPQIPQAHYGPSPQKPPPAPFLQQLRKLWDTVRAWPFWAAAGRKLKPLRDRWNALPEQRRFLLSIVGGAFCVFLAVIGAFLHVGGSYELYSEFLEEEAVYTSAKVRFDTVSYSSNKTFILDVRPGTTQQQVEENLFVTPKADFRVTAKGSNRYEVRLLRTEDIPYVVTYTDPKTKEEFTTRLTDTTMTVDITSLNLNNLEVNDSVVLVFSKPISQQDAMKNISIYPEARYDVQVADNTAVIVPYAPYDYNTKYTITVKATMTSLDRSAKLTRDKTFTFTTQKQGFSISMRNRSSEMLTLEDDVKLEFATVVPESVGAVDMIVELYRFPDLEKYLTRSSIFLSYDVNVNMLDPIDVDVLRLKNEVSTLEMRNPGLGAYLIHANVTNPQTGEEYQFRKVFSVTDLSLYAQSSNLQTLAWAHSSATGDPLEDYEVEFYETGKGQPVISAVTDADGVAILEFEESSEERTVPGSIVVLRDPDGEVAYVDNTNVLNNYSYGVMSDRYYSFFFTDRPLYKPDDEIQFWGYLRSYRNNSAPLPSYARIVLGEDSVNQFIDVPIGADGTFSGTLPLEAVKSSHYRLVMKIPTIPELEEDSIIEAEEEETETETAAQTAAEAGEEETPAAAQTAQTGNREDAQQQQYVEIGSQYLQVKEYVKPTYVIETSVDQEYYLPGDDVTVTVEPTFYDGTPMPNYDLEFRVSDSYYGSTTLSKKISTNADGVATITFPAYQKAKDASNGWTGASNRYSVRIADDGEDIIQYGSYNYFPVDLLFTSEIQRQENGNVSVTVGANAISFDVLEDEDVNISGFTNGSYYGESYTYTSDIYEPLLGEALDMDLQLQVEYSYYNEKDEYKSGTREYGVTLENGRYTLEDVINVSYFDDEGYYSVRVYLEGYDSSGRKVLGRDSWYSSTENRPRGAKKEPEYVGPWGYHFIVTNGDDEEVFGEFYQYQTYRSTSFGAGETMNFNLYYDEVPAENNGRILWTFIQDHVVSSGFSTNDTLTFTQSVENANSFTMVAAYFDGYMVHPILDTVISFNKESIELEVEVTPDRETYSPADPVTLSVRVTDRDGNGVAGNTIVAVVDESIFALQEQSVDVMYDLYRNFYFSNWGIKKYTTTTGDYVYDGAKGDGGKGDGGNLNFLESLRKNFKDTAFFQAVRTNANGVGSASFTLPDNVTSWRITAASIGDNLYAGQSKSNFITTMPFFMKPVISTKYIDGDDVAIRVQGHGIVLEEDADISYAVNIEGDGVNETIELQGKAYQSLEVNFGKLPQGEYTIRAAARYGEYYDAVELPLAVISSNLELVITRTVDLEELPEINAMRYPVTISFYDKNHDAYYSSISSLLTHYCNWASQRMSRFVAKRALSQHMDPDKIPQHIAVGNESASDMQNYDGGIGKMPGMESDTVTTAHVLIIARDQFNLTTMTEYFNNVLRTSTNQTELGAAYLGLAVIGEPVQKDIERVMNDPRTTEHLRLYLIAAMAYLEDETEEALALYEQYITPNMVTVGDTVHYSTKEELDEDADRQYENDRLTAAAWIAASRLGLEDADGISLHFAGYSWRISTLFECMIYVTHYDKEVLESSLSYTAGGRTETVNLGVKGQTSVSFNKSEFQSLQFGDVTGDIRARAYFIGEPSEADIQPSELFTVKKDINYMLNDRYRVTITIDFEEDAPSGYYDVSEWIPSNMRLYQMDKTNRGSGDRWYYNFSTEGQKIYYRVYCYGGTDQVKLEYIMQKTFDAEAVVDSTYVIHGDSGENNLTPRTTLQR